MSLPAFSHQQLGSPLYPVLELPSERDDLFWDPGRPGGLDRDPDDVLGRMQRFDDQDAAGLRMSRHHCSVFRRGLATASFMQQLMVLVVRVHS